MTHFPVLVILPESVNPDSDDIDVMVERGVERLLAPYDENDDACKDAKWDWWTIGGRWLDGGLWPKEGAYYGVVEKITMDEPFRDLVTPDGEWHECGAWGWFGTFEQTINENNWRAQFYEILSGFRTRVAVVVDCHI